nr:tRNA (adenosine(37)-N6)-dimethylallyltransferase MiaA [Ardenticatena sp.]
MTEEQQPLPPLIAVVGPTAVGKTATAIALAQAFDGEIVSADSRQLYIGMDIGTAKPTPEEQAAARHHLIDILTPDQQMTLADFQDRAYAAIADITARGKVPLLVGGTGLYVRAVLEGYRIPRVPPNPTFRHTMEELAAREGPQALYNRLQTLDPKAAANIDPRNVRRVIRALEVIEATGEPFSAQQGREPPPYDILRIGLTMPREDLYARADARIRAMWEAGWVDEVRRLLAEGYTPESSDAMKSLGYPEVVAYVRGEITDENDVLRLIGRSTRRFIRQQYGWFRLDDPRIHWFDVQQQPREAITTFVAQWLAHRAPHSPLPPDHQ